MISQVILKAYEIVYMIFALGTNHPFLHIIIHIIIIIIFLFRRANANLCASFLLKPIGVCFLHHWPGRFLTCLRVTGGGFIISANIDDRKAIQVHTKWRFQRDYRAINYPEILTISADIPIAY